jgi:hypothetical protein
MKINTLLTARLYEPKDKSLSLDFLKRHPVTTYPELYKEVKRGKRVVKNKCVTNAFVNLLVDELQSDQATFNSFKYHGSGTGTADESASDTALGTEVETRNTGTQTEGSSPNIYKSVATHTYGNTYAITEHGLFNASTAGTLMDRSKFAAINVVSGNQIEFTYELTCSSGG